MYLLSILGHQLNLLPEKAIYIDRWKALLVSDVHLGKSETFQSKGIPIPNHVNQASLDRLQKICLNYDLEHLFILGDLFHSKHALVDEVLHPWLEFVNRTSATIQLIIGNHDRSLIRKLEQVSISCVPNAIQIDNLIFSHEPEMKPDCLNICGHIHPCVRIKTKLDDLRLPCFFLDHTQNQLILPSFGEFTGGYEMSLSSQTTAYVIAENSIIPFSGKS